MTLESLEKLLCQMHSEKSLKEQPEQKMVLKDMEQVMVVIITKKKKQLHEEWNKSKEIESGVLPRSLGTMVQTEPKKRDTLENIETEKKEV